MKGRRNFTINEINRIREIIKHKSNSPSSKQKPYRDKLRKIGFYITDFDKSHNEFTDTDLEGLIRNGIIVIDGKKLDLESDEDLAKGSNSFTRDEEYILHLCDEILGYKSLRQHRFDFLRGDPGINGRMTMLPVDAYYKQLNLVIEYREKQHTVEVEFFDKFDKLTVSGVHRGEQRKIYDERRRIVLPQHGINLIEISYEDFDYDSRKRIIRNRERDKQIVRVKLHNWIDR